MSKTSLSWIKAVCIALARDHGVRIEIGKEWSANIKTKVITYNEDIAYLSQDTALGLLLHEIGHVRHTTPLSDLVSTKAIYDKYPFCTGIAINAPEDIRIDHIMRDSYENAPEIMDNMLTEGYERVVESSLKFAYDVRKDPDKAQQVPEILSVMGLSMIAADAPMGFSRLEKQWYKKEHIDDAKEIARYLPEARDLKSTEEVGQHFMEKIYPIVEKYFTDDQEEKMKEELMNGQSDDDDDDDDDDDGDGSGGNSAVKLIKSILGQTTFKNKAQQAVHEGAGGGYDHSQVTSRLETSYEESRNAVKGLISGAKAKFNRILKDNSFQRFAGRFNSGRLNMRRLYKQRIGDYKLFQRKTELKDKEYAFSIMYDVSGSMSGSQFENAFQGVALLAEVFNRIGVDFQLIPYSCSYRVAKEFGAPLSAREINKKTSEVFSGGTEVIEPYKHAVESLLKHKARAKVLVLMTDGAFSDYDDRHIIESINKYPEITQHGIGISVDLKRIFDKNAVEVKNAAEITGQFIRILNKHIHV